MIHTGTYQLNKSMTFVDVEKCSMVKLPFGETIEVVERLQGGKCKVKYGQGEIVAMEMTLQNLYLDGWIAQINKHAVHS